MIDFDQTRWLDIKKSAERWWQGELDRPLVQIRLQGRDIDRQKPKLPYYEFTSFYDLSISEEMIIDRIDYQLGSTLYLGDAFPQFLPNFGPGVLAAFLGARLQNGRETVWFHPRSALQLDELEFSFEKNNVWYQRLLTLIRAATARWQDQVQIGMTDLGGNLDILSAFRPGEKLIYDLYDQPNQVEKMLWQAHELWWRYFKNIQQESTPCNPGYSCWTPLFSEKSYYMLQCDFCYMIGPRLFEQFVKPELEATVAKLQNPFYHLDGPGQLKHLDSILTIERLKGVQWIPGAGQPDVTHWPEVYQKILSAGKRTQLFSNQSEHGLEVLERLADQLGTLKNVAYIHYGDISEEKTAGQVLAKYGVI